MKNNYNNASYHRITKMDLSNVNVENLTYLLAVIQNAQISLYEEDNEQLPYSMKDFTECVKNQNLTYKQLFRDFGYFLERSEDERIKGIVKDLVCNRCTFYRVSKTDGKNVALYSRYYARINMPFPNNIVVHVLETVKDLKQGKKEFEYKKPYTRVSKTFDDGIEIIPEQQK